MTLCRALYRYARYWWRTSIEWRRILLEGGAERLVFISVLILNAFFFVFVPDHVVPRAASKIFAAMFIIISVCLLVEFVYTFHALLFPRVLQFYANELRDPGFAWLPDMQENPPELHLDHPMDNQENLLNEPLRGWDQRPIVVQGNEEWLRREQPPAFNPPRVPHQQIVQKMRTTDTVRTRTQRRPPFARTQAQPPVKESAWSSLNPQPSLTGVRRVPSEIADKARSLLMFRDEGQRSCGGQNIEMHHFVGAEGTSEQGESSCHSYYPINYQASGSKSTKYGWPEISQQNLRTRSIDDSFTRKSESDDSNRSSRGKGEDNSSNKSSPEKDESRAPDADSIQGGSKASNKSFLDKNESDSPHRSSPEKDQSDSSNRNSPEKPEDRESSPHSHTQSKTSETGSLRQTTSLSPGSSSIMTKSTVIKMSGVGLGESNEPIKTHKSSSSKSSYKQKDIILIEKSEEPPKQKITKKAPVSATSLTGTSISKRKVSSSEEQHSDLEPFPSAKKKVPKSSSEISPKPSTSGEPGIHSFTRRVGYPVKRKRETSSEEEDDSSTQSKKQSPSKPRSKIPKIDEEAQSKRQSSSKSRPMNPEDSDSESSN